MTAVDVETGDCFKVAAEIVFDQMTEGGVWLCHGQPRFRGESVPGVVKTGDRYWHAWVETQTTVYDFANGRSLVVPIEVFYVVGAINAVQVRRYTYRQAHGLVLASGHWGPWEPK